MEFNSLGDQVKNGRLFKGAQKKPLLAPRGVFVSKNTLVVSDTGQNRVFIWNTLPTTEYEEPDVILGQISVEKSGRNSGGLVSSRTLQYPSGLWTDGEKLIVADAWNHRVLIWLTMPVNNAQPADVVIGQPDFESNLPNVVGIGSNPNAQTLNWPYGVFSDGKSLWIADTGNRRIMFFNEIPAENYSSADKVIGKESFTSRDYNNRDAIWPYSVKFNEKGYLAVADTQFYRVLVWKNKEDAFDKPADIIIGQNDFEACGQNQFRLTPKANTLNWTYDACFYKNGLLVNDTGNSRILKFDTIPNTNNASAESLIGRKDFETSSEFKGNLNGTNSAIYWPFSITTEGNMLFIADTGNHRLIICELKS